LRRLRRDAARSGDPGKKMVFLDLPSVPETETIMTARARFPDRRASETFPVNVGGRKYKCTISRFPDGRLAEIFLSNNRVGSDSDCAARDSAVVCSIALQHGVPVETIRRALMREGQGRANGPLGVALDLLAGETK
jgi:hypothetical protein